MSRKRKAAAMRTSIASERSPDLSGLSLIEQFAAAANIRCANSKAPILFGDNDKANKAIVIKTQCKQWSCPSCGARLAKQWIAKSLYGINHIGGQWYFMTLTARSNQRGSEKSLAAFRKGWDKLRKRIVRLSGKFDYVKVHEMHKDGTFHLHLILNAELPYKPIYKTHYPMIFDGKIYEEQKVSHYYSKWLKDNAFECGLGYIVDYQPLHNNNAGCAYYVAKYLAKSIGDNAKHWVKGIRRIETSRTFPKSDWKDDELDDIDWTYVQNEEHMFYLVGEAMDSGKKIFGNNGSKTTLRGLIQWMRETRKTEFDQEDYDKWMKEKLQRDKDNKTAGID
jgi:hypothetical protein